MVMKLYDTDLVMEREFPELFSVKDGEIHESVVNIQLPAGRAQYREICFDGVHIGYGNAELAQQVILNFESDFETVEMHFALKGNSSARTAGLQCGVDFERHQHNIIYANQMSGEMHWNSREFCLFEVNLSPVFFKKYLPEDSVSFNRFRRFMEDGQSGILHSENRLISLQMYRVIDEIIHCNRKGLFKRMFLEAKVIELLLLQLEQGHGDGPGNSTLKKKDTEKIYAVREYILSHLQEVSSLADLARTVGTNEFILKKGFRELFGTTVFGFWNDAKMEQARKMLSEQGMNVCEVSDSVGYKNPRHFSAAFKKKFGVSPGAVR